MNLWTVAHQAPLSMEFSRQEYWSALSCPPSGNLPDPGIEPIYLTSTALADRFFTISATWISPRKQKITYNWIPIRLTSRREWQKWWKEKKLQPRLLYSCKDLIQIPRRNEKFYRQTKAKSIQHRQFSPSTSAKWTCLDKKQKRIIKQNPKQ